jgi:hypothetical protein
VGNAVAHGAGTDDSNPFNGHEIRPSFALKAVSLTSPKCLYPLDLRYA